MVVLILETQRTEWLASKLTPSPGINTQRSAQEHGTKRINYIKIRVVKQAIPGIGYTEVRVSLRVVVLILETQNDRFEKVKTY